jgi:hypothetical protein
VKQDMKSNDTNSEKWINQQTLLEWFVLNNYKTDNYSFGCLGVILGIFYSQANIYFDQNISHILDLNYCWSNFILLHMVIVIFMAMHSFKVIMEIRLLAPSSIKELKSYINEKIPTKDIFSGRFVEQKTRKIKLGFALTVYLALIPLMTYSWIDFLNSCSTGTIRGELNFSLMGLVCYSFVSVRIPFYLIGLTKFTKT